MDLARSTWEPHGVLILNCLRQMCFKLMWCWTGATETAGGVEAVQILVDAVTQGFSDSRVEVESLDRAWFRFAKGHWSSGLSRVWLLTPLGWISINTLDAENVPILAGMNLLQNHDISFRRNEFLVYDAEGQVRSVSLRRSPSSHRTLNSMLWSREQNLNVSSAFMFGLSRHPVAQFCQHANPAPVNSHRTWSVPVSTQSDFAVFPHEHVRQPSFLQSKLRSIRARLSHLQTVIDGQESRRALEKVSKLYGSRLAHDGRDPRSWPQTRPCRRHAVLEQS